jgi:hypothetical protein
MAFRIETKEKRLRTERDREREKEIGKRRVDLEGGRKRVGG